MLASLRKLRGRSSAELRARGTQAALAWLERVPLVPDAREPSDQTLATRLIDPSAGGLDALLADFRAGRDTTFFAAFRNVPRIAELLRSRSPEGVARIIERADAIVEGRSCELGLPGVRYGDPIDWHRDPRADRPAPRRHWRSIPYLDTAAVGDHKTIWEINRHQYFVELGQAYALTGDDRYAATFALHLGSWLDANPPKLGINWASSLEVAFRAMSWIWALHFFRQAPALGAILYGRTIKYLYLHARHLERYLSTYFSPNTHLTGEALGLFVLGCAMRRFRAAPRWLQVGWSILVEESARQIRPDGVYFEQASWYHRYTVDFYLHAIALAEAAGITVDAGVRVRCEAAAEHLMWVSRPDGTIPLVGDDDGGRLVRLDALPPADVRAALATAAVMFGRPDLRAVAGELSHETIWVMGERGVERFDQLCPREPDVLSRAFHDGGYYVVRDGWRRDASWALFDCGPHGAAVNGYGHAHADALSLEICVRGRPVFVDPGTFTYSGRDREEFRSTAAHNTVAVDGESSSEPAGTFRWATAARCVERAWIAQRRFDYVAGEHDGYRRLVPGATHRRSVLYLKNRYWVIHDRVQGGASHAIDVRWHAAAGTAAMIAGEEVLLTEAATGEPLASIRLFAEGAVPLVEAGSVSEVFGQRTAAPVLRWHWDGVSDLDAVTVIAPPRGVEVAGGFAPAGARGGRAWMARGVGFEDVLLVGGQDGGGAGSIASAGLETDARVAWLRRSGGRAVEFVMIDGGTLHDGDDELVSGPRRGWVAGTLVTGRWNVESGDPRHD